MAFSPLANFQKYKKIWMASIILLCMVTFVLCSGFGGSSDEGGFGGWLMRLFRGQGEPLAEIDGSNYYPRTFQELKDNRELANKFMRKLLEISKGEVEKFLKTPDELKKRLQDRELDGKDKADLYFTFMRYSEKLRQRRFFEGTSKLNDLVDFKVWLAEADRLGIQLNDTQLSELIFSEVTLRLEGREKGKRSMTYLVFPEEMGRISLMVRQEAGQREATDDRIANALRDEFRVMIAKLGLLQAPDLFGKGGDRGVVTRLSLTPDEWWHYFAKYRNTFDVALFPVSAVELAKHVPTPEDATLAKFFRDHKDKIYDPTSDQTGLRPARDRFMVHFLMADPESPLFDEKARKERSVQLVQNLLPPLGLDPLMPPLFTLWPWGVAEQKAKFDIDFVLETEFGRDQHADRLYGAGIRGDGDYGTYLLAWFAKDNPQAKAEIANLVAAPLGNGLPMLAAAPLFAQEAAKKNETLLAEALAEEQILLDDLQARVKKEMPKIAGLAATYWDPLTYQPLLHVPQLELLAKATDLKEIEAEERFLPFRFYRVVEEPKRIKRIATSYTQKAMIEARKRLKLSDIAGNQSKLKTNVRDVVQELGLKLVSSARPYTVHELETAPELAPLRIAFEKQAPFYDFAEARADDKKLTDKPFGVALFFSPTEKYSVQGRSFTPTPWPPDIEVQQAPQYIEILAHLFAGKPVPPGLVKEAEHFLKNPDPRETKTTVEFFKRSETPILFWKEDPPKTDPPLRWEDEIRADLKRTLERLHKQYEEKIGEAEGKGKGDPKLADMIRNLRDREKAEAAAYQASADKEVADVRARTLEAYKLAKARDDAAPLLAKGIALDFALSGGLGHYGPEIMTHEEKTNTKAIRLDHVAVWHQPIRRGDYKEFKIDKKTGVVLPRPDMAKMILDLPTLDKAFEFKNDVIDPINKELFAASVKAFERLKGIGDTKPRIVQIIPNQARTLYYIALLTGDVNPPEPSRADFKETLTPRQKLEFIGREPQLVMDVDPFLARVQTEATKEWERRVIDGLRRQHGVVVHADSEAAKSFESEGG